MVTNTHNHIDHQDNRTLWWTILAALVIAALVYAAYSTYDRDVTASQLDRAEVTGTATTTTTNQ